MSKWQDIAISDANLKAEFITRFFNGDYISAFRIIEDNPQLNTKVFLANVMNEISNLLSLLQNNFQSNVIDYLANELDGFNNLINEFNLKGSWDSETTYEIYNFVIYNDIDYLYINPTPSSGNLPTNTNYWLEINIRGKTGEPGLGVNLKYDWDSTIEYQPLDVVYYNNALWVATATNVNKRPDENSGTIWQTLTGNIITFTNNNELVIQDIDVNFSPIQDLNGYEAPWPPGGGKNKASPLELGSVSESKAVGSTYSEMQISSTSRARTIALIPTNGQQYTVSMDFTNYRVAVASFDENQQYLGKASGWRGWSTVNFTQGGASTHYVALIIKRADEANLTESDFTNCHLQLEIGTSATTYAPYSNICPISGWTGVTLKRTGKNLSSISTNPSNPYSYWGGDFTELKNVLNSLPIGTYTISNKYMIVTAPDNNSVQHGRFYITAMVNGSQQSVLSYSISSDSNAYVGKIYEESGTFTITESNMGKINHCYCYCDRNGSHSGTGRGTYNLYDIQIEVNNFATNYEQYNGVSVTLTWGAVGKNLLNLKASEAVISGWNVSFPFKIKAGTYIISCQNQFGGTTNKGAAVSLRDANNNNLLNFSGYQFGNTSFVGVPQTVTEEIANATTAILFGCTEAIDSTEVESIINAKLQLELGSSATAYEPYQDTIYGGTASDNGDGTWTVTVDRVIDTFTKNSGWYSFSTGTGNSSAVVQLTYYQNCYFKDGVSNRNGAICSTGKEAQNYWIGARQNEVPNDGDMCFAYSTNGQLRFHRTDIANITDLASFKANFPDTQICYYLATPLTFTVTADRLTTLVGVNNVWADTNEDTTIELAQKYWEIFLPFKLIKIYSNTTAPTGDDLYNGVIWFEMLTS